MVGRSVGQFVAYKGGKLHCHAPMGALIFHPSEYPATVFSVIESANKTVSITSDTLFDLVQAKTIFRWESMSITKTTLIHILVDYSVKQNGTARTYLSFFLTFLLKIISNKTLLSFTSSYIKVNAFFRTIHFIHNIYIYIYICIGLIPFNVILNMNHESHRFYCS